MILYIGDFEKIIVSFKRSFGSNFNRERIEYHLNY